jgi:hypothetical protein
MQRGFRGTLAMPRVYQLIGRASAQISRSMLHMPFDSDVRNQTSYTAHATFATSLRMYRDK